VNSYDTAETELFSIPAAQAATVNVYSVTSQGGVLTAVVSNSRCPVPLAIEMSGF